MPCLAAQLLNSTTTVVGSPTRSFPQLKPRISQVSTSNVPEYLRHRTVSLSSMRDTPTDGRVITTSGESIALRCRQPKNTVHVLSRGSTNGASGIPFRCTSCTLRATFSLECLKPVVFTCCRACEVRLHRPTHKWSPQKLSLSNTTAGSDLRRTRYHTAAWNQSQLLVRTYIFVISYARIRSRIIASCQLKVSNTTGIMYRYNSSELNEHEHHFLSALP